MSEQPNELGKIRITKERVRELARGLRISAQWDGGWDEWKIRYPEAIEARQWDKGYFTDSDYDALCTMVQMFKAATADGTLSMRLWTAWQSEDRIELARALREAEKAMEVYSDVE